MSVLTYLLVKVREMRVSDWLVLGKGYNPTVKLDPVYILKRHQFTTRQKVTNGDPDFITSATTEYLCRAAHATRTRADTEGTLSSLKASWRSHKGAF